MKHALAAVSLALALFGAAAARASGGGEPLEFLRLDASARAIGMGGAYTALTDDANALFYNPAGLAHLRRSEATFMHNQAYQGVTQDHAAYAHPRGWGAGVNRLAFNGAQRTTIANPDGTGLGSAGLSDLALIVGYGHAWGNYAAGAAIKYIRSDIAGVTASAYAVDLGALADSRLINGLSLGAALQNIGPAIRFQRSSENLPTTLKIGSAYRFNARGQDITLALDAAKERSESLFIGFGAEALLAKRFPLRLGYSSRNDAGLGVTIGAGYRHEDYSFDYAFAPYGSLGTAHRLSGTLRWGTAPKKTEREIYYMH